MTVVRNLAKSYDQKFGARSIIHEIQNIAVNMLADAHIRGDLKYKLVSPRIFDQDLFVTLFHKFLCPLYDR